MRPPAIALVLAIFAVGGCVGDPPDISAADAGAGGTGQGPSDGGSASADDGGTGGGGNGSGNSGSSGDGSGQGNSADAGSCASVDNPNPCGGGTVCCAAQDPDDVNPPSFACEADGPTCEAVANAVAVTCRSADDCTGSAVCCGRKADDNNTVYATIRCEPACTGAYTFDHALFCNPDDAHACDGRPGYPLCKPSDLMPGMYDCSDR